MIKLTVTLTTILFFALAQSQNICKVLKEEISGEYEGACKRNLANGFGVAQGEDVYKGYFRRGLPHGNGKYVWSNGDIYEGEWRKGEMHGIGEFTIAENDSSFFGRWRRGKFVRLVDTTSAELPAYKIHFQRNLTRTRFLRTGSGNKVLFNFEGPSGDRRISGLSTFGTSGNYISYSRLFGYENVEFPFEGKISFTAPSRSGLVFYQIELFFVINEPGLWEISLGF